MWIRICWLSVVWLVYANLIWLTCSHTVLSWVTLASRCFFFLAKPLLPRRFLTSFPVNKGIKFSSKILEICQITLSNLIPQNMIFVGVAVFISSLHVCLYTLVTVWSYLYYRSVAFPFAVTMPQFLCVGTNRSSDVLLVLTVSSSASVSLFLNFFTKLSPEKYRGKCIASFWVTQTSCILFFIKIILVF